MADRFDADEKGVKKCHTRFSVIKIQLYRNSNFENCGGYEYVEVLTTNSSNGQKGLALPDLWLFTFHVTLSWRMLL